MNRSVVNESCEINVENGGITPTEMYFNKKLAGSSDLQSRTNTVSLE